MADIDTICACSYEEGFCKLPCLCVKPKEAAKERCPDCQQGYHSITAEDATRDLRRHKNKRALCDLA